MMFPALENHRLARLTILDCGSFDVGPGKRLIGLPAYLLETNLGAKILVDGGFPPAYGQDAAAAARADGLASFGQLRDYASHHHLTAQLALTQTRIADLTAHILTHGHIDHVGALPLITCPLILTATERADPRPCYFGTARPMTWPDLPTHQITETTPLCHGLTLIPTPGHTPGHLSLVLDLPETGPVILAADALNRASEPDEDYADAADRVTARQSGDHLLALQRARHALLIYGHDPNQWPHLRKAPQSYS
jgi:N-acyl homoserine lactone hydrolase